MTEQYSQLRQTLLALPLSVRQIWSDPHVRHLVLANIVEASLSGEYERLGATVSQVDDAIVTGLMAFGLPRGPVRGVRVENVGRGWLGQKSPACDLILDGDTLRLALVVQQRPDEIFRTWVHESLHGRQPYALPANELRLTRGYEEGLVEGLARFLTRDVAQMTILDASYAHYVAAYHALAVVLQVEAEALWRALWHVPTGMVREAFIPVVDEVRLSAGRAPLPAQAQMKLRALADRAFASALSTAGSPDKGTLERTFMMALQ